MRLAAQMRQMRQMRSRLPGAVPRFDPGALALVEHRQGARVYSVMFAIYALSALVLAVMAAPSGNLLSAQSLLLLALALYFVVAIPVVLARPTTHRAFGELSTVVFLVFLVARLAVRQAGASPPEQQIGLGADTVLWSVLYAAMALACRLRLAVLLGVIAFCALFVVELMLVRPDPSGRTPGMLLPLGSAMLAHLLIFALATVVATMLAWHEVDRRRARLLEHAAGTDVLTSLPNRRGIAPAIERALADAASPTRPHGWAIALVDVDRFKQINDCHGHGVGDEVLVQLGLLFADAMPQGDHVARWGGEEFVLVMQNPRGHPAHTRLSELRRRLHARNWPAGLQVTISFGLTALVSGDTQESALARADSALYAAKTSGRDCIAIA